MNKKIIIFAILSTALCLLPTITGCKVDSKTRTEDVKAESSPIAKLVYTGTAETLSKTLDKLDLIIKEDVNKALLNMKSSKKMVICNNDYVISGEEPYIGIIVEIIKFTEKNYLVRKYSGGSEWTRDLKKGKNQFLNFKEGNYEGEIHVFREGYQYSDYVIKCLGDNKFIIVYNYNPSGGTYHVTYTTFAENNLIELDYYMQDDSIEPTGAGGNLALIISFKKVKKDTIDKLDSIMGGLDLRSN